MYNFGGPSILTCMSVTILSIHYPALIKPGPVMSVVVIAKQKVLNKLIKFLSNPSLLLNLKLKSAISTKTRLLEKQG